MTWITLPQNNVLAGQAGHLNDHDDIYAALAAFWGAAQQSTFNVQAPPYNATGNGSTDDTVAIQNAINACSTAGGGVVYFPEGTYKCTPSGSPAIALSMSGMQGVRLVGAGALKSVLLKNGTGSLLSMSGPSTDTTGATHCKYCSISDLQLNGNANTGTMLLTYYADNLYFENARFYNNYDVGQDTAEFWDSKYYNCVWEDNGSVSTPSATMPNVWLRGSAAASGFGYTTDNVDNISFANCRWEDFRNGAVRIEQGVAALNNPNSIMFTNVKMESSFLNGGVHFYTDATSRGIFLTNGYFFSGGFEAGFSTAQDVIQISSAATALKSIWISDRTGTASVANGITVNSTSASMGVSLEDVFGIYNDTPTGSHINFGTATGPFKVSNCTTTSGTLYGGTLPSSWVANTPLDQTSGAVSDGSFPSVPLDGTMGLDILNHRLYLRENGGTWAFIPIKTITSAVTASTTVANTAALSTLQTASVPANDPQTGSVYEVFGHGIYSTTGTPTMTFALYWGGTGGTLLASIPAITAPSGASSLLFEFEAKVTFRSSTSCIAVLKLTLDTSSVTDVAAVYVGGLGTTATVTTSSAEALAVGFTWGTASASNTITAQGGYTEKIR